MNTLNARDVQLRVAALTNAVKANFTGDIMYDKEDTAFGQFIVGMFVATFTAGVGFAFGWDWGYQGTGAGIGAILGVGMMFLLFYLASKH